MRPAFKLCTDRQLLRLAGQLAAVLFRVLLWHCAVWVRGGVVHLLVQLVVEGPALLCAALLALLCTESIS